MSDIETFLKLMKSIESDSNPDAQHRTIASGMHEGDTAVGAAGLMPNTATEMAKRKTAAGEGVRADELFLQSDNATKEQMLRSNPDLRADYVKRLANHVMTSMGRDPELASVAWRWGHNMSPDRAKEIDGQKRGYMQRVEDKFFENNLMSEQPQIAVPELQKAITPPVTKPLPLSKVRKALGKS
jgi:hypothetical protein